MIKIFGKVRYHWQPDVAILIIYWSLSVIPIFVGLALMYESSRVPTLVLFSFFLFMVLLGMGVHRYFTIYDDGTLRIITANPFTPIRRLLPYILKGRAAAGVFVCASGLRNILSMPWPLMSILRVR